jgi:hypothetical protein
MEQAAEKAMVAGMSPADFYQMLGTFVGYAAANDPRATRQSVEEVIGLVVATAWSAADTRLGQCRGTVQ